MSQLRRMQKLAYLHRLLAKVHTRLARKCRKRAMRMAKKRRH